MIVFFTLGTLHLGEFALRLFVLPLFLSVITRAALLQNIYNNPPSFYCIMFDLHSKTPSSHGDGEALQWKPYLFVGRFPRPQWLCTGLDSHVWGIWWVNSKCSLCFGISPFATQFSGSQWKLKCRIKKKQLLLVWQRQSRHVEKQVCGIVVFI